MLREPVDTDGLLLPRARPSQAWSAVMGLRVVAAAADDAAGLLATSDPGVEAWTGSAAQAYRDLRAVMSVRVQDLRDVASAAAEVVHTWLLTADDAISAMRIARAELLDLQQAERVAQAAAGYAPSALEHELDVAWARWRAARHEYWVAIGEAVARLATLREAVRDHPTDLQDNIVGFVDGVWERAIAQPAVWVWGLTGAALTDRQAWQANVAALPDNLEAEISDPLRSVLELGQDTIDLEAWRHGRYGEGAAALAVMFVPKPSWLRDSEREGLQWTKRFLPGPQGPRPLLQTVEELLAGVDLDRSEHPDFGHTLRRHVDVGDDYLMDRLTHGTIDDDGQRGPLPSAASRFNDRRAANLSVTETLRANEHAVRAFLASHRDSASFTWTAPSAVGTVMRRSGAGFVSEEGRQVTVVLRQRAGDVYVYTATVDR